MLKRIETSDVMRRATQAFDEHNERCPTSVHFRNTADGPVAITRKVGLIPESVTTTFHTVLTEYVHAYNRTRDIMPLYLQDPASPPALFTTGPNIAKFARCSARTVRNHLTRLEKLGFLTRKFRGDKHAFQVWISPKYLYGEVATETAKNAALAASEGGERKIFPHSSTHREILGTEKGSADMLIVHGESIQGQRGETDGQKEPLGALPEGQKGSRGGAAGAADDPAIAAQGEENGTQHQELVAIGRENERLVNRPKAPKGMDPKFTRLLFEFWLYAWKVIYPTREFSKQQQENSLAAISKGVFENFQGEWSDEQWLSYYQVQLAKVDKAGRYYDNHPDAYLPDPYAVHIPGKGYFDIENLKGFIGIDSWIKQDAIKHAKQRQAYADKQEEKTRRAETLLRTARRDFEKLRSNAKPRKEVAKFNQLALFQYYNVIFSGLGKKWQEAYCKQFLEQQSRDFQAPTYYKPRKIKALAAPEPTTVVQVESWMTYGEGFDPESGTNIYI
ncbi:hypothetical protein SAMN04487996_10410 [Dyadobacter soli]|uniref:Uncharacterized protein n=1 Tax=Dyadobacter soli TaxID=659014 RepID=A0A1G7AXU7_9BACT|nr:hypothetical protein [Dyadobacter soli]SDE19708.1 hypothetical protein SAMN04487996_10410 [Dyadobacter soli]